MTTSLNTILNAVTLEHYVWLEGRIRKGVFKNLARCFRHKTDEFSRPTTEVKIVELVKKPGGLRVFGPGHSFNIGVVSNEVLVFLEGYSGQIWVNRVKK